MSTRLITFEALSEKRFLLDGMMAEFPFIGNDDIFVGEIIATAWWPGKHIRFFQTVEGQSWNSRTASWAWQGAYRMQFKFEQFEMFSGPYEIDNGDIFFMIGPTFYVRFFHKNIDSTRPIGANALYAIHRRFIDPEPPQGTIA